MLGLPSSFRIFFIGIFIFLLMDPSFAADPVLPSAVPSEVAVPKLADFQDEVERDFPVYALGRLQITNLRGGITVQGWSQDRIRVRGKRRVLANDLESAKAALSALDMRFSKTGREMELSAEYGRGMDIQERLQERRQSKEQQSSMDLIVLAPSSLRLRVLGVEGAEDTLIAKRRISKREALLAF